LALGSTSALPTGSFVVDVDSCHFTCVPEAGPLSATSSQAFPLRQIRLFSKFKLNNRRLEWLTGGVSATGGSQVINLPRPLLPNTG